MREADAHDTAFTSSPFVGVDKFDVSLEKQLVTVEGPIAYDTLLEKIKKTGKEASCSTAERKMSAATGLANDFVCSRALQVISGRVIQ